MVRGWVAVVSMISLILTARFLGAEGRGEISLLIANIALIQLVIDIADGPAIIYLVPRGHFKSFFFAGFVWLFVVSALIFGGLIFFADRIENLGHFIVLSFLYTVTSFFLRLFQGQNRIPLYNVFLFLQHTVLFISVLIQFFVFEHQDTQSFIWCLYLSYGVGVFAVFFFLKDIYADKEVVDYRKGLGEMLHHGWKAQLSNVVNFFNGRLSYYLIAGLFFSKEALGQYATAVALAEAVWVICYSLSAVQYPLLTRSSEETSALITSGLNKISFYLSAFALLFLAFLPSSLYEWVLGKEFGNTGMLLLILAPGIVTQAVHKMLWNYFSAAGEFHTNNISNIIALIIQAPVLYVMLRYYALPGAAVASSVAGFSASVCLLWYFRKRSGMAWKDILPGANDWKQIMFVWKYRDLRS